MNFLKMLGTVSLRNLVGDYKKSLILIGAITAGVAGLTFFQMVNNGFIEMLIDTVVNSSIGHIQIHHKDHSLDLDATKTLSLSREVIDTIASNEQILAFTSRIKCNGLLSSSHGSYPTLVYGIDPKEETQVADIGEKLTWGRLPKLHSRGEIAVGEAMARQLKVAAGDRIVVMARNIEGDMESQSLTICGLFRGRSSLSELDRVYLARDKAKELLSMDGDQPLCHEIAMKVKDIDKCTGTAVSLTESLQKLETAKDAKISTWAELEPVINGQIELILISTLIMFIIVFIALSFGIFNSFMIEIFERMREFAIIMAIGANRRTIFAMLMAESFFIGLCGSVFGVFTAWVGCQVILGGVLDLSFWGQAMAHFDFASAVPLTMTNGVIALSVISTVTVSLLSTIYPALKAAMNRPLARAMRM